MEKLRVMVSPILLIGPCVLTFGMASRTASRLDKRRLFFWLSRVYVTHTGLWHRTGLLMPTGPDYMIGLSLRFGSTYYLLTIHFIPSYRTTLGSSQASTPHTRFTRMKERIGKRVATWICSGGITARMLRSRMRAMRSWRRR